MVKYPIGIQDFESLRTLDFLYVDKTKIIFNLILTNKYIFLSHHSHFGKSLTLSTHKVYFEGKKELFQSIALEKLENLIDEFESASISDLRHDDKEIYFHKSFYITILFFLNLQTKGRTSTGRVNKVEICTEKTIYVIELQLKNKTQDSLDQINSKENLLTWCADRKKVFVTGIPSHHEYAA